jgi:hypothetical protein
MDTRLPAVPRRGAVERLRLTSPGPVVLCLSRTLACLAAGAEWRGEGDIDGEAAAGLGTCPGAVAFEDGERAAGHEYDPAAVGTAYST